MGEGKQPEDVNLVQKICETKAGEHGLHGAAQLLWGSGQWQEMWHGCKSCIQGGRTENRARSESTGMLSPSSSSVCVCVPIADQLPSLIDHTRVA